MSNENYLRFLHTENCLKRLEGTKTPKEGKDELPRDTPNNGKARQSAGRPWKGLSDSDTEASSSSSYSSLDLDPGRSRKESGLRKSPKSVHTRHAWYTREVWPIANEVKDTTVYGRYLFQPHCK